MELCLVIVTVVATATANDPALLSSHRRVVFEDRPGGDIVYKLNTRADVEALKSQPFILKEKCMYATLLALP